MYLLAVVCLAAATAAAPLIPDPPSLPERSVVLIESPVLRATEPEIVRIVEIETKEKKDKSVAEEPIVIVSDTLPEAPILPPLDESLLDNIKKEETKKPDGAIISDVDNSGKEEPKEVSVIVSGEESETLKKDDVEVKVEEIDKAEKPEIVKWGIPTPPIIGNIISSLPHLPLPLPLPSLNWPLQIPSIFNPPRISYPGYVLAGDLV